ncbi:DNA adenine methyltransferase [Chrysochromulina tobinii]|uniref:DNA adenine methyltransferase n=1 Tax=Chrysochromulina tobinii TaxID=1460289 RepID=A0A0M0K760_9EUKA|nr:DNA adenine methyltransferase [Chrysochromulina tobinii]|eukprot:KOO34711.1 DNA adenine methyltransferase [Chrysochromulina sp. CCMP291]
MSAAASSQLGTKQPAAKAQRFPKRVHKQPSQPQMPFVRPTIYSTENPAPDVNEAHLSITHGDCVEGMKLLANASVDLVIADPPYDIGVGKAVWDTVPHYMQWSRTWLAEAVRVLKPGGALMLYGSPERLWICHLKIMCADEFGLEFKQHISWVYKQGGDSRMNNMVKYAVRMEHLEWFVKPGAGHTFNLDAGTEAYSEAEFKEALAKGVGRVTAESLSRGKPPKNWWDIPRENSRSKEREYGSHPSMKPLRICDRIVGIHSNVGDTVLVPFGGSGSECVAVGAAGRKLVAYEQEAEYHRIIVRRMKGPWRSHRRQYRRTRSRRGPYSPP